MVRSLQSLDPSDKQKKPSGTPSRRDRVPNGFSLLWFWNLADPHPSLPDFQEHLWRCISPIRENGADRSCGIRQFSTDDQHQIGKPTFAALFCSVKSVGNDQDKLLPITSRQPAKQVPERTSRCRQEIHLRHCATGQSFG